MDLVHQSEPTKTTFELGVLGTPVLRDASGQVPAGFGSGKPLALLCYLVVRRDIRRDEAIALLWGDVDEDRARNAFRQALHRLRLALGDDVVVGDRQNLRIGVSGRLRVDLLEFEAAIDEGRLEQAIALYPGNFLEGVDLSSPSFDQWADAERERVRSKFVVAAADVVQRALSEGRLDSAEETTRKLIALAPLDRRSIEMRALLDQVSAAQRRRAAPAVDGISSRELTAELARLLAAWRGLDETTGATVVVEWSGPNGSSPVREFVDGIVTMEPVHALRASESAHAHGVPYAAIAAALRPLVRAQGVAGASPQLLAEASRLLPELRDVFQLPTVDSTTEDASRLRMYEGVAALIEAAAYEQRICLMLEDAQLAHPRTLELLGFLSARLKRAPVLLLVVIDPVGAPAPVLSRVRALGGDLTLDHRAVRPRVRAALVRQFPHWRYLLIGALTTLLAAILVTARDPGMHGYGLTPGDTLVLKARGSRGGVVHLLTGAADGRLQLSAPTQQPVQPPWADSLTLPWVNPKPAPTGRYVAVERITPSGSNLYLISSDRRDTIPLAVGELEAFGMGWSPDGKSFLATRSRTDRGDPPVGLYVFSAIPFVAPVAIDTLTHHSVTEAAWSPDGSRIAWVARVSGQEEIFVAWADGSNRRNVSDHPAQDYHLAWSADGSLMAFTSWRDGNAELYAYDLIDERLWRLTRDLAQDDRAAFANDGRYLAFESTRGGRPQVYLMPSLGGETRRLSDSTSSQEIVGWRRSSPRYLDRLAFDVPERSSRRDDLVVRVRGFDQRGAALNPPHARWTVLERQLLRALPSTGASLEQRFLALDEGLARIEVTVGAWRTDTAYVKIGDGPISLLVDAFGRVPVSNAWHVLGRPAAAVGRLGDRLALILNADRQWESGALSVATFPLMPGLSIQTTLYAPFDARATATSASLALVAPEARTELDTVAPSFLRVISASWNAEAQRFVYAVDRELFAESIPEARVAGARAVEIVVNADATVSFFVDDVMRWRSTVRVPASDLSRAQLWLGGQDTGARAAFSDVRVTLRGAR